jgi:periplasmic mercuric ion binding protein
MNNRIVNIALVLVAATLLTSLALRVRVGVTADSVAVLKTGGMTCGSCAGRITKALEALKGVAVTEVDVEGGWVIVGYDTKMIKPEPLAEKVKNAGFSSTLHLVLTPEQFKRMTGKSIDRLSAPSAGCCGSKGGCTTKKQS